MVDCKNLVCKDKSVGSNDIFDHPSYDYLCKIKGKEVIPCIHCNDERCENYESID